jgi:hypothetical protein
MRQEDISDLGDAQLLDALKAHRPRPVIDAFFIGFLVGVVLYGLSVNAFGLLALIPLFLLYGLLKKPRLYRALRSEAERRGLI